MAAKRNEILPRDLTTPGPLKTPLVGRIVNHRLRELDENADFGKGKKNKGKSKGNSQRNGCQRDGQRGYT